MIQRFGGGLNLKAHFHTLVLDGVYAQSGWALVFHGAPPTSHREVWRVVVTVVLRLLARRGFAPDVEAARDPLVEESPHSGRSEAAFARRADRVGAQAWVGRRHEAPAVRHRQRRWAT